MYKISNHFVIICLKPFSQGPVVSPHTHTYFWTKLFMKIPITITIFQVIMHILKYLLYDRWFRENGIWSHSPPEHSAATLPPLNLRKFPYLPPLHHSRPSSLSPLRISLSPLPTVSDYPLQATPSSTAWSFPQATPHTTTSREVLRYHRHLQCEYVCLLKCQNLTLINHMFLIPPPFHPLTVKQLCYQSKSGYQVKPYFV